MSELRGIDHDGVDRSIDMRISRLRQALADNGDSPARIKTVRGQGYLFSVYDREDLHAMTKPFLTAEHQL
jgi:DNA-binding response OmpR family regulator